MERVAMDWMERAASWREAERTEPRMSRESATMMAPPRARVARTVADSGLVMPLEMSMKEEPTVLPMAVWAEKRRD